MTESELIVSRTGRLGSIVLNRPEALNSLTLDMVRCLTTALDSFATDSAIAAVLVKGAGGRALCAGGDIRRLYEARMGERDYYKTFWREEYELNARIAHFPKPYVVVMDGLVMGGGVGISAHGNRRVVTERTRLAMPEAGIGFIPDVGGTWLLTRKGGAGRYMALSGVTVGAADAIHVGLADGVIESRSIQELAGNLGAIEKAADVDRVLVRLCMTPPDAPLAQHAVLLDHATQETQVEGVIAALEEDASDFARQAAAKILGNSPTSVKTAHELLKRAAAADSLEVCLRNEFRAACSLLDSHDLYEGIRAAIIDKDRRPRWRPATLAEVDDGAILAILEGTGDREPMFRSSHDERAPI